VWQGVAVALLLLCVRVRSVGQVVLRGKLRQWGGRSGSMAGRGRGLVVAARWGWRGPVAVGQDGGSWRLGLVRAGGQGRRRVGWIAAGAVRRASSVRAVEAWPGGCCDSGGRCNCAVERAKVRSGLSAGGSGVGQHGAAMKWARWGSRRSGKEPGAGKMM
jgi:hypothetical protein